MDFNEWSSLSSSERYDFKGMEAGNVAMIYGITSQRILNGRLCRVVRSFKEEDGRYIVKLIGVQEDGKKIKLRPGNLIYQPEGMVAHSVWWGKKIVAIRALAEATATAEKKEATKAKAATTATAAIGATGATMTTTTIRVPEDCPTIDAAMARARADRYSVVYTISLAKGVYTTTEKDDCENDDGIHSPLLHVHLPISFVGRGPSKMDVVFMFGIQIQQRHFNDDGTPIWQAAHLSEHHLAEDNIHVHLQKLTVRNTTGNGILGSGKGGFTLEDVLIEHCTNGLQVTEDCMDCSCTNVEIRSCRNSGAIACGGATITFKGPMTKVHHNECKWHTSYGLKVADSEESAILLVEPLTRETVAVANGGGKNFGFEPIDKRWLAYGGEICDLNKQIITIAATAKTTADTTATTEAKTVAKTATKKKKIWVCTACQKRFEHKLKLW
jgi:hypothetical protein